MQKKYIKRPKYRLAGKFADPSINPYNTPSGPGKYGDAPATYDPLSSKFEEDYFPLVTSMEDDYAEPRARYKELKNLYKMHPDAGTKQLIWLFENRMMDMLETPDGANMNSINREIAKTEKELLDLEKQTPQNNTTTPIANNTPNVTNQPQKFSPVSRVYQSLAQLNTPQYNPQTLQQNIQNQVNDVTGGTSHILNNTAPLIPNNTSQYKVQRGTPLNPEINQNNLSYLLPLNLGLSAISQRVANNRTRPNNYGLDSLAYSDGRTEKDLYGYQKGGTKQNPPKVYTDPIAYNKAARSYNDSLALYKYSLQKDLEGNTNTFINKRSGFDKFVSKITGGDVFDHGFTSDAKFKDAKKSPKISDGKRLKQIKEIYNTQPKSLKDKITLDDYINRQNILNKEASRIVRSNPNIAFDNSSHSPDIIHKTIVPKTMYWGHAGNYDYSNTFPKQPVKYQPQQRANRNTTFNDRNKYPIPKGLNNTAQLRSVMPDGTQNWAKNSNNTYTDFTYKPQTINTTKGKVTGIVKPNQDKSQTPLRTQMKRLPIATQEMSSSTNIQFKPFPSLSLPQQGNIPFYGPGSTIIGYTDDDMHFYPTNKYIGAKYNEHNLQDKVLIENPEELKKYVLRKDNYKFQNGGLTRDSFNSTEEYDNYYKKLYKNTRYMQSVIDAENASFIGPQNQILNKITPNFIKKSSLADAQNRPSSKEEFRQVVNKMKQRVVDKTVYPKSIDELKQMFDKTVYPRKLTYETYPNIVIPKKPITEEEYQEGMKKMDPFFNPKIYKEYQRRNENSKSSQISGPAPFNPSADFRQSGFEVIKNTNAEWNPLTSTFLQDTFFDNSNYDSNKDYFINHETSKGLIDLFTNYKQNYLNASSQEAKDVIAKQMKKEEEEILKLLQEDGGYQKYQNASKRVKELDKQINEFKYQKGGQVNDNKGYLLSNLHNFTSRFNSNNKTVVKPSNIQGKGLFANKMMNPDEFIGLAHKNGQPVGKIGNYHNHSENPNSESILFGNNRYIKPKRPLFKGEEITVDYRQQPELEQPDNFQKGGTKYKKTYTADYKEYSTKPPLVDTFKMLYDTRPGFFGGEATIGYPNPTYNQKILPVMSDTISGYNPKGLKLIVNQPNPRYLELLGKYQNGGTKSSYKDFLNFIGNPKLTQQDGVRAEYDPKDNSIIYDSPRDLPSEYAHAVQNANGVFGYSVPTNKKSIIFGNPEPQSIYGERYDFDNDAVMRDAGKLNELRRRNVPDNSGNSMNNAFVYQNSKGHYPDSYMYKLLEKNTYMAPGTTEYDAHQIWEPRIRKEFFNYQEGGFSEDNYLDDYLKEYSDTVNDSERISTEDVEKESAQQEFLKERKALRSQNKRNIINDILNLNFEEKLPSQTTGSWRESFKQVEDPNSKFNHGNGAYGSFGYRKSGHLQQAYKTSPEFEDLRKTYGDFNNFWNTYTKQGYGDFSNIVDNKYESWLKKETNNNIAVAGRYNLTGSKTTTKEDNGKNNMSTSGYIKKLTTPQFKATGKSGFSNASSWAISLGNDLGTIIPNLQVNSIYRSPEHNKSVGGGKNSFHLEGKALDIKPQDWRRLSPIQRQQLLAKHNAEAIDEGDHIHIEPRSRYQTGGIYMADRADIYNLQNRKKKFKYL